MMDRETAKTLIDALDAAEGIVAMVGAGGKKSTMYRLLEAHRAIGTGRILLTATVQIAAAARAPDVEPMIIDGLDADAAIEATRRRNGAFLLTGPSSKPGRQSGLPQELIPTLHAAGGFDVSLVKADGARMRMIKAPREDEPALPDGVSTVLPIVSARVFGRALDDRLVHRPERLIGLVDAEAGAPITPEHVARLLSHPEGALRRAGDARVVPIVNMVEDGERLSMARAAARQALAMTDRFDRVVLASMTGSAAVVDIVSR